MSQDEENSSEQAEDPVVTEAGKNGRWPVAPSGRPGRTVATAGRRFVLVSKAPADAVVHLFELDSGKRTACLDIPEGVHDLALSPDGERLVTVGREEPLVRLWRCSDGASVAVVNQNEGDANAVAWTAAGDEILVAGNRIDIYSADLVHRRTIAVPVAEYDRCCQALYGSLDKDVPDELRFWTLAPSPRGDLLVATEARGNACVIDQRSGRLERVWGPQSVLPQPVAFANSGAWVVSGVDEVVKWNPYSARGHPFPNEACGMKSNRAVELTDDDRRLLTACGSIACISDTDNHETLFHVDAGTSLATAAFLLGGRYMLVCAGDGTNRFHRTEDGQMLAMLALLDDGTWLVTDPYGERFDAEPGSEGRPAAGAERVPGLLAGLLL